ncbi:replication endonuclease [Pseudoroseomonas wenyumeiae]
MADKELSRLWALFRARLDNAGISTLGMRVYEGHEDGCPHLHALLYVPPTPSAPSTGNCKPSGRSRCAGAGSRRNS